MLEETKQKDENPPTVDIQKSEDEPVKLDEKVTENQEDVDLMQQVES